MKLINKKKKIIFFINHAAFFISHRLPIAKKLINQGYDVVLITGQAGSIEMEELAIKKLQNYDIRHIKLAFKPSSTNLAVEVYSIIQLIYYLICLKSSLLHCVSPKAVLYGSIAAFFSRTKSLVVAISGMGHIFTNPLKKSFLKRIIKFSYLNLLKTTFFLNKNLKVIVQNNDDYNFLLELKMIDKNKLVLIKGSGVNLSKYVNTKIENKEKIVLLAGRMLKEKGVYEFISAAKKIKPSFPDWNFVLIGAAGYDNPSAISAEYLNKTMSDGIIKWLGHVNNIEDYMKKSSIVCLPSYREGMPKVLLEAAAAGCAVVTTDVPGCREAIIDNQTGFIVPLYEQEKLNAAILELINNIKLREKFGKNNMIFASQNFGIESVVDKHIEIYNDLLRNAQYKKNR